MHQRGRIWVRAALASGAALVLLVAGVSTGRPAASASNESRTATAQVTAASGAAGSTTGAPSMSSPVTWCCPGSAPSGLTVTGQASVRGQSTQSRDAAIAQAVTDATDQATTVAKAANLNLGKIVEFQVSASGYPSPYPLEAGAVGSTGAAVCQPSGCFQSGGGLGCPGSTRCAPSTVAPIPVESFATVTITWAIG